MEISLLFGQFLLPLQNSGRKMLGKHNRFGFFRPDEIAATTQEAANFFVAHALAQRHFGMLIGTGCTPVYFRHGQLQALHKMLVNQFTFLIAHQLPRSPGRINKRPVLPQRKFPFKLCPFAYRFRQFYLFFHFTTFSNNLNAKTSKPIYFFKGLRQCSLFSFLRNSHDAAGIAVGTKGTGVFQQVCFYGFHFSCCIRPTLKLPPGGLCICCRCLQSWLAFSFIQFFDFPFHFINQLFFAGQV
jgi:hypothetical protein